MSFINSNSIGIGITTPNYNLDVSGNCNVSNIITANGYYNKVGNFNYNLTGGGSTITITLPSSGMYLIMAGFNYNDINIATSFYVITENDGTIITNIYIPPSIYNVTIGTTSGFGFTISADYPSNYTSFEISYMKFR